MLKSRTHSSSDWWNLMIMSVNLLFSGIITPAFREDESFAFSMCNPPFFSSWKEAGQNPGTAFQGTATEMVCPDGELAFVQQMVDDSLQLKVASKSLSQAPNKLLTYSLNWDSRYLRWINLNNMPSTWLVSKQVVILLFWWLRSHTVRRKPNGNDVPLTKILEAALA